MLCYLADGAVGEGGVMVQVLGDVVDEEETGDGAGCSYIVEERGRKRALEHVDKITSSQ